MFKKLLPAFFLLFTLDCIAQVPGLNYARNLGGSAEDIFTRNVLLRNGNLVSVGYTQSTDGQSQGSHGSYDCLVICTSPDGVVLWKKVIGGSAWDAFNAGVDTTTDGNIVVGFTAGSNDGDIAGNHGGWDIAFFKYTADGNLLWSKTYGGSETENFGSLSATPDGGIIALTSTASSNSGNVTGVNHGNNDVWIIKLDKNGLIEWQKLYGGTGDDMASSQFGGDVVASGDGGYFFTTATSSLDGDLNGLLPPGANSGGLDIWLCHIDNGGNIVWSKLVGGSGPEESSKLYTYGTSLYLGFSTQSADRDLQGNLGLNDMALFKYNTDGQFQWKRQYASSAFDFLGGITGLKGDLLTVTGGTYSFSFEGYPTPAADERLVVMRIDTLNGSIKWFKGLGGNGRSQGMAASINNDGSLFISGLSTNTTGDIYANIGSYDAIVLSFATSNRVTGKVFVDSDNSGSLSYGDLLPNYLILQASKTGSLSGFTSTRNGDYTIEADTGNYTIAPLLSRYPYYTANPAQFTHQFLSYNETFTKNIALQVIPNINDLTISLTPISVIRPGRPAKYLLTGYNVGTNTIPSGTISFTKDPRLTYLDFSTAPNVKTGDDVSWNFSSLQPFDSVSYVISMDVPITSNMGIVMNYVLKITPVNADATPENNTIYFRHTVVNSFDPNCKSNNMGDSMPEASVKKGEYIYYTIQFQNTGTASAIDIFVKDTLPASLLDSTFEIVSASHPFGFNLKDRVATWTFFNINLPDSNSNEKQSHGYIQYRIKAKPTLVTGDVINNTAAIYFDFNDPVITDNNQIKIYTPPVIVPPAPVITPAGNISFCTPIVLSAPAGTGYQWYKNGAAINGATANTYLVNDTGTYTATITVNNEASLPSAATTVSVGAIDSAVISSVNNVLAVNNADVANAYTWQVLNNGTWADINPVKTGSSYSPNATGDYRVSVAKGICNNFSNSVHWDLPVVPPVTELKIYPNPVGSFLKITNLNGTNWQTAEIVNVTGLRVITPISLHNVNEVNINTRPLSAGVYVLVLRDGSGKMKKIKFIKE